MDDRDCLAFYPFIVVRIACRVRSRGGSYRLARLAAISAPKSAFVISQSASPIIASGKPRRAASAAGARGVYLPDLEQPRPPDVRPGLVKLRLVKDE